MANGQGIIETQCNCPESNVGSYSLLVEGGTYNAKGLWFSEL